MRYRFLPWARLGVGSTTVDTLGAGVAARTTLPVHLRVNARQDIAVTALVHGPGDVVGIDTRLVVRTDPPNLASEFEPNYFPLVEFDRPDVPWLFTPATGDAQGRLRPWIVLVVVRRQPGVSVELDAASRRPVLKIAPPARPAVELPDLADSWAWAHAQVVDPDDGTGLDALLAADSTQNLSRLVCPRRLAADTAYIACVVPAFEIGRRAGLGLEITADDERELTPAWTASDVEVDLPVLYRWDFSTGDAGDFESLVKRLTPRPAPEGMGTRPLAVNGLGFGLPDLGDVPLGGALRPIEAQPRGPLPSAFATAIGAVLDLPAARQTGGSADPVVGPPIYGSRQAAQPTIAGAPPWIVTLNEDPRLRAVAGLGSLVVQDQQEHLMAAAWDQLGTVAEETRQLRQPLFAGAVLGRVRTRLATLDPDLLMSVAAPLMARVPAAMGVAGPGTPTLQQQVVTSRTPTAMVSAAFRKAVRPQGSLARRVAASVAPPPDAPAGGPPVMARMRFVTEVTQTPTIVFQRAVRSDMVTTDAVMANFDQLVIISLPDAIQRNIALRAAVDEVQTYYQQMAGITPTTDDRTPIFATAVRDILMVQLDPAITIAPTIAPLVASPPPTDAAAPEPPSVAGPDLPGPTFPQPMFEPLRDLDPQYLLPGCDLVVADSVVPLASDAAFIEAYMTGLNHEMSRELLWREYPSDERSTSFRVFWTPAGADPRAYDQLPPLHEWTPDSDLGNHFMTGTDGNLVVLVRGELFHRYPGTVVYLTRSTTPGVAGSERVLPLFRGDLLADMTFLGFGVSATDLQAEPWFVVFEQQPTEPRFGLDADTATGRPLDAIASWNDATWGDLAATADELAALSHVPAAGRLAGHRAGTITWGTNSGHQAAATLQRSFRIAIPLTNLVTAP
jgi:hypothetical protein